MFKQPGLIAVCNKWNLKETTIAKVVDVCQFTTIDWLINWLIDLLLICEFVGNKKA